jgi:4-alpha-glucanotransferase
MMKRLPRASGLLFHPTSLPGPFGVGDLGPAANKFIDLLAETGQRWWQILPLGPTGYGNSPYQSYSSFAGNPLLISPEVLLEDGLLRASDLDDYPEFPEDRVDFDAVIPAKDRLLRRAFERFKRKQGDFETFITVEAEWLDDYALYMALKESHAGRAWYDWEPALVIRDPSALAKAREQHGEAVRYFQFVQFLFDRQWRALRGAGQARGVGLIGDLPIYVAQDCADVWARPDLFQLDAQGRPTVVAGVPPDYFAETGQLWGNPLYRWQAHEAEGFSWWIKRLKAQLARVDLVRLDHFRGFEAYWEVPAGAPTAVTGRWAKGPGTAFLEAVRNSLDCLPIVAEDLGDITTEVYALRDRFDLPGMRVLQFGFSGEPGTEFHLPYSYINHCIAYTGTHDNDTTLGWFTSPLIGTPEHRADTIAQRAFARKAVGSTSCDEIHWAVTRAAFASVADTVIVPLQDVLGLGGAARMNVPGRPEGNWCWRMRAGQLRPSAHERLAELTGVTGRWNGPPVARYGPPHVARTASLATTPAPTTVPAGLELSSHKVEVLAEAEATPEPPPEPPKPAPKKRKR